MTKAKIIASTIFLTIITLTSCKKTRQCVCGTPLLEAAKDFNDTKKNAQKKCDDFERELQVNHPDMNCELQ